MTKLTKNELLEALAQYGYELNKPVHRYKGEEVLLNLIQQNDARLLEGFPVAYKNILEVQKHIKWDSPDWDFKKVLSDKDRGKLLNLVLLTYVLFKLFGEEPYKLSATQNVLSKLSQHWQDNLKEVEEKFSRSETVKVSDTTALSTDRLRQNFRNYVVHAGNVQRENEPAMTLELELLLSEFFTPKQKELLKKRLKGERLSKTENETFSRVINKRLKALASSTLHRFVKSANAAFTRIL